MTVDQDPSQDPAVAAPVLQVDGVSIRFGGHLAVDEASLEVYPGQIVGLIGPNGAGKTTTFNAISGVLKPTTGRVFIGGQDVSKLKTHKRARLGLGRTFQRLEVFKSLTVRDNLRVSAEIRQGWSRDREDFSQEIEEIIDRVGLREVADVQCDQLPTGQNRLMELGRALAARPQILLLDEPASGLTDTETHALGDLLRELVASGVGILIVEHDVGMVMRICDYIHVLDFGKMIAHGLPAEIQSNKIVQDAYLGSS